jgi:hypothetical protein
VRNILVGALVLSLSGSPALAQSLHDRPAPIAQTLRESALVEGAKFAAAQAAQAEEPYRPGGMSPAYFWTSVGLMIGGAGFLTTGALVRNSDSDTCDDIAADSNVDCEDIGTGMMIVGGGLVGSGLLVWVIGKNKAKAVGNPQIVATPRGVALRGRIQF